MCRYRSLPQTRYADTRFHQVLQPFLCWLIFLQILQVERMDHHFDAVLGGSFSGSSSSNHSAFIPAKKFDGKKDGYFFQNGDRGLGYYLDKFGKPNKYLQPVSS